MLSGIDVSHWQSPASIQWTQVAASQTFAICKATDGVTPDRYFDEHYSGARQAGLRVGAYLFFRVKQSVVSQVDAFCRQLDLQHPDDVALPPALDVEDNEKYDGAFTEERYSGPVTKAVELLLNRYGSLLLYTSQRDWARIGDPECIKSPQVMLWVAHYTMRSAPATPMNLPYTFWQYRGAAASRNGKVIVPAGRVVGCGNQDIDVNQFTGTRAELPVVGAVTRPANATPTPHPIMDDTPTLVPSRPVEPDDGIDSERIRAQVAVGIDDLKRDFFDHEDDDKEAKST